MIKNASRIWMPTCVLNVNLEREKGYKTGEMIVRQDRGQ